MSPSASDSPDGSADGVAGRSVSTSIPWPKSSSTWTVGAASPPASSRCGRRRRGRAAGGEFSADSIGRRSSKASVATVVCDVASAGDSASARRRRRTGRRVVAPTDSADSVESSGRSEAMRSSSEKPKLRRMLGRIARHMSFMRTAGVEGEQPAIKRQVVRKAVQE